MKSLRRLLHRLALASGLALAAVPASPAAGAKPKPPADDDCLACHEDSGLKRSDGREIEFRREVFAESVHGQAGLACVDCHADLAKASEFPHQDRLAAVECAACHDQPGADYAKGIHAEARHKAAASPAAACRDCHGSHDIFPAKDNRSRTYHLNLPQTCGRCHGDPETIKRGKIAIGNVSALYEDSIHGKALRDKGLMVAPNCADCHGSHDVRPASDQASHVHRPNVPATCGKCHEGIRTKYETSIHWKLHQEGNPGAAVCIDCHSAHGIRAVGPAWRLDVIGECGTCHEHSMHTYRDGFHGQVTALGFTRVATCADCHGSHDITPRKDPRSRVAVPNRPATCGKCHPRASASFVKYDPHAEPGNRERSAALYYTGLFMKMLLGGVFAFFGIHTALWFPREIRERRRRGGDAPGPGRRRRA